MKGDTHGPFPRSLNRPEVKVITQGEHNSRSGNRSVHGDATG